MTSQTRQSRGASAQQAKTRAAALASRLSARLALLLTLAATVILAGCSVSSGSSGINFSLGLQGSTADNPAPPPKIAASGPSGEYAFVYDNQVWAHASGASAAVQVTRLTLSNGATIVWGPLVWSPSGKSLAFAVVQNMATNQPMRDAGTLYYVDLSTCLTTTGSSCSVYQTAESGSVYGHSYDWLNDDWLIAGGASGISAYDISDPNGWRVWQLRTSANTEQQDYACGQPRAYGDVQVVGTTLYYTCINLSSIGSAGAVGTATLNSLSLSPIINDFSASDAATRDEQIATTLNAYALSGSQVTSLGNVYQDVNGDPLAGAWAVNGTALAFERIGAVDTQHATAARTICATTIYSGGCDSNPLGSVTAQTLKTHPQISLGANGAVAYQGDALYVSGQKNPVAVTSPYAPQWLSGGAVLATNVLSTTTDASGVTRSTANLVIAQGSSTTTLIAGASDVALH